MYVKLFKFGDIHALVKYNSRTVMYQDTKKLQF